jgi:hypothetical protein
LNIFEQEQARRSGLGTSSGTQSAAEFLLNAAEQERSPGIVDTAIDLFTGDSRRVGNYPEYIDYSTGTMGGDISLAAKTLFEADPQARAEILKNNVEGSSYSKPDKFGNIYWKDPKGQVYIMNDPGLSQSDFNHFAAEVLKFLPAGRLAVGTKAALGAGKLATAAGVMAGAVGAGGTELASDFASKAVGREKPINPAEALGAAVGGGLGELLGPAATALAYHFGPRFNSVVQYLSRTKLRNEDGSLTPQVAAILKEAGIDIDQLSQPMQQRVGEAIQATGATAKEMLDKGRPGQIARSRAAMAAAEEIGSDALPNTQVFRAEAVNDYNELGALYRASREAVRGGEASNLIRNAFKDRARNLAADLQQYGQRFANDGVEIATEAGAGDVLNQSIATISARKLAEYKNLRNMIPEDTFFEEAQRIPNFLRRAAVGSGDDKMYIAKGTTPQTVKLLDNMRKTLRLKKGQPGAVNQNTLEELRQVIDAKIGPAKAKGNHKDVTAMIRMKDAIDDWQDHVIERGLVRTGRMGQTPQETVKLIRTTRDMYREYKSLFGKNRNAATPDQAAIGRTMENAAKFQSRDVTGLNTIEGILGPTGFGTQSKAAIGAARIKDIFGENSPEFGLLQQAAWRRIIDPAIKNGAATPERVVTEINNALTNERSAALAKVLFKPQQIAQMREIAQIGRMISTRRDVYPTSPTAPALVSYFKELINSLGVPIMMGSQFGPAGFVVGRAVTKVASGKPVESISKKAAANMVSPITRQLTERSGLLGAFGASVGSDPELGNTIDTTTGILYGP